MARATTWWVFKPTLRSRATSCVSHDTRLENAEFARYGVMHRNTFVDAPRLLDDHLRLRTAASEGSGTPVYVAGQLAGTEGYCEAIRSGFTSPSPLRLIYVVLTCRQSRAKWCSVRCSCMRPTPIRLIISRCMSTSASCRPLEIRIRNKKRALPGVCG